MAQQAQNMETQRLFKLVDELGIEQHDANRLKNALIFKNIVMRIGESIEQDSTLGVLSNIEVKKRDDAQ